MENNFADQDKMLRIISWAYKAPLLYPVLYILLGYFTHQGTEKGDFIAWTIVAFINPLTAVPILVIFYFFLWLSKGVKARKTTQIGIVKFISLIASVISVIYTFILVFSLINFSIERLMIFMGFLILAIVNITFARFLFKNTIATT